MESQVAAVQNQMAGYIDQVRQLEDTVEDRDDQITQLDIKMAALQKELQLAKETEIQLRSGDDEDEDLINTLRTKVNSKKTARYIYVFHSLG